MNDQFSLDDILSEYSKDQNSGTGASGRNNKDSPIRNSLSNDRRTGSKEISAERNRTAELDHVRPDHRAADKKNTVVIQNRQNKDGVGHFRSNSVQSNSNNRPQKNRRQSPQNHGIQTLSILLIAAVLLILAGGLFVTYSGLILPNVSADNVDLSMLSSQKAYQKLQQSGWEKRTGNILTVKTYQDVSVPVDPVEAGILLSTEDVVNQALRFGKEGNIFANLVSFFRALGTKTDINGQNAVLNTAYIKQQAAICQEKLNEALGELYRIDEDNAQLLLVKGQGSMFLNTAGLESKIVEALHNGTSEITFKELLTDPVSPDMNLIHSMVCTGAEDATFSSDGTHTLLEGKPGYEFNMTEAQELWNAASYGDTVTIPLTVSHSTVTVDYLESMMFHDLLGAVTTKYNNSGENRRSNVRLAASKIDGTVLFPGEEFSFNDIVGVRSEEAGFLSAPAYAGYNDIKEEIGGGVCQVSSGVYAAALFSFLDITKHTCHVYPPNYIQLGTDATVTIPESGGRTIDLRFVNSKNWPVKIVAYCEETEDRGDGKPLRTVTVEIWGTLEDDDYMPVEFDNSYIDIYDYDRIIEPAYPDREGYKIKFTHDEQAFEDDNGSGIRTATHRKVYDSKGNLVEDKVINPTYSAGYALDTYYFMQ